MNFKWEDISDVGSDIERKLLIKMRKSVKIPSIKIHLMEMIIKEFAVMPSGNSLNDTR